MKQDIMTEMFEEFGIKVIDVTEKDNFMDTNEVLNERGKRYGNYLKQTTISRRLKNVITDFLPVEPLTADQQDALDMICVKISRILNGDPDYSDNWRDIAGYASLVADRLDGKERE